MLIVSAMRTLARTIFRIADYSLSATIGAMTFHKQLSGFSAADLIAAFPGIPRSTAYDWLAGTRWPAVYLQPVVLAHMQRARPTQGNKSLMPSAGKRLAAKRRL